MNIEFKKTVDELCRKVDEASKKGDYKPEKFPEYEVRPFINMVEEIPDPELVTTLKGLPERILRFIGIHSPATCNRLNTLLRASRR
jgi:hypothetical protein